MKEIALKKYVESISKIKDDFWVSLQEKSTTSFLEKGEQYAKMGEKVRSIGFLLSGVIRIYYLDDNGHEWNKAFLEPPAFLLSNINYEDKSQVYFEALTKSEILKAPISFFVDSLSTYPSLQKIYQYELGKLFQRKSEREVSFMKLNAKERYLAFKQNHPHLLKKIPQYHIASYLGITPTQLSRIKISIQNQQM